ncbi:MAG: WcaF family extracellular polysaccharide biosynthesis acetyltransferase [Bryobacteraceae bacterium]|jgi:putative colanic acid biosynthesis acetyltransferase WcaF
MSAPDLTLFDNSWYSSGRTHLAEALWFFLGLPVLRSRLIPFSFVRGFVLRVFGANIAPRVVLKPGIRVKYPWLLSVGANSWIGEDVWIDNLAPVRIGSNACVSQGAYLCTGNHNWADPAFRLIVEPLALGDGSWVGARAMICPGANLGECSVASAGSVVTKCIPPFEIHAGNPARLVRHRRIGETT